VEPTFSEAVLTGDYTQKGVPLSRDDIANYLSVLVRLAALDGFEVAEKNFIHRAAAALGLEADLARNAHKLVDDKAISTETLVARIQDKGLRLCLLRDAYRLAAADEVISPSEIRELATIAKALGIDHRAASAVRSIALQEARLQGEFTKMVSAARA